MDIDKKMDEFFELRQQAERENASLVKLGKFIDRANTLGVGDDSVKSLSAQFATLCELPTDLGPVITLDKVLSASNKNLTESDKAVMELQLLYGLRITEVLRIDYTAITSLGSIRIRGLKSSEDRLVTPVIYQSFWLKMRTACTCFPSSLNRFYFYRLYKRIGLYDVFGSNKNKSVTHMLRYNYVCSLIQSDMNIFEIQQLLGHKSINSTIHYVDNIRNKKRS